MLMNRLYSPYIRKLSRVGMPYSEVLVITSRHQIDCFFVRGPRQELHGPYVSRVTTEYSDDSLGITIFLYAPVSMVETARVASASSP